MMRPTEVVRPGGGVEVQEFHQFFHSMVVVNRILNDHASASPSFCNTCCLYVVNAQLLFLLHHMCSSYNVTCTKPHKRRCVFTIIHKETLIMSQTHTNKCPDTVTVSWVKKA